MFSSNNIADVKVICQDISPKASGLTAFEAISTEHITGGFLVRLSETISFYGVALDQAIGGWAGKHNRRTGQLLQGWFMVDCANAAGDFLRGIGGYTNSINVTREAVARESKTNPLRERAYIKNVAERGGEDVNIT